MKPRIWIAMGTSLSLAGCTLLKPDHSDVADAYVAERYSESGGQAGSQGKWWHSLNAPELNQLMDEAFAGNLTLAQYAARLRQQQALVARANAGRSPSVTGSASAGTDWPDVTENNRTEAFALGLSASYELDLWGRVHSTSQAALLNRDASHFDLQSAMMTLSANTADIWLAIISQQAKLDLLQRQLKANTDTLELLQLRQRHAIATSLDVLQQQQIVEATRSLIPAAELQLALLKSQLSVLLGRTPGSALEIATKTPPSLPALPSTGLPADLLRKRPDIQAGLARLEAQDYAVAAARAARLPTLTLSGSLSATDRELGNVLDNWAGNLAAGLVAPLIDGGRRRAEVEYQQALAEQAVAVYRSTVLTAITEVNDALQTEQKTTERLSMERRQQQALDKQLNEAGLRYRNGLNDYLAVLTALAAKQHLDRNLIATQLEVYSSRIELHRALGGDWMAAETQELAE